MRTWITGVSGWVLSLALAMAGIAACAPESASPRSGAGPSGGKADDPSTDAATDLDQAIANTNATAAALGYELLPLDRAGLLAWYQNIRSTFITKDRRQALDAALLRGQLPAGYALVVMEPPAAGLPPRIVLWQGDSDVAELVDGRLYETFENYYLPALLATSPPTSIDETTLTGASAPIDAGSAFPSSVPVSISEVALLPDTVNVPALDVRFTVTPANLEALARYFGNAYDLSETRALLDARLGGQPMASISLVELLHGWARTWVNRFPFEKAAQDQHDANDVCHGVAREFFMDELQNGDLDRSTQASQYLLITHYALVPDSAEPSFGDYLYLPGTHSIRFMLKDPSSGRWIGVSAWSDSHTPYRVWWVDQDYRPSTEGPIDPAPNYPTTFDVWRRRKP